MVVTRHREQFSFSLNDSNQLTQALAANVREGIAVLDRDLRFVLWNPCLEKLTRLAAQDIVGKQVLDVFPSFDDLGIERNMRRALAGESFSAHATIARNHGRARIIHNTDTPFFDPEELIWTKFAYLPWRNALGAIAGVIIVVSDLTERLRASRQLKDNWVRNQAVIDRMLDGMAMVSSEGLVESFNAAAERLFGYRAEEVVGQNVGMLFVCPFQFERECNLQLCPLSNEHCITGGGQEVLGQRKDGSTFPLEFVVSNIALRGGHMFTALLRDISRRKAAEEELRVVTERLRQLAAHQESVREAERVRIAHELHDELGGLLTAVRFDMNRLGQLPDIYLERVGKLRDTLDAAIRSTRSIISDLHPPVLDQLGLWGAIEWYAQELANRCALNLQVHICPDLQDLKLPDDVSISLFRIVQESLSNIVKHAEARLIIVRARRLGAAWVEVEVIDDGKGLNKLDLAKTGHWGILGMYERVRGHCGELTLEGAPDGGTALRVKLPIA